MSPNSPNSSKGSSKDSSKLPPKSDTGPAFGSSRKVILLSEVGSGRTYRIHKERLVIGSIESADVRLSGEGVAPIHAVLELNRNPQTESFSPAIYDLASPTGLFVNGAKVITKILKDDDKLTFGRQTLSFRLEDLARVSPAAKVEESEGRKLFLNPDEDLKPLLLQEGYEVQEIFDYRPTTKPALEVIMSWMGTVLDVRHFVERKLITVGNTRSCDFAIPAPLSKEKFPFVTSTPGGYILHIDPRMKGVVQRRGELKDLEDLRGIPDENGMAVGIDKEDFAKISIDDVNFYLSFTAAPPRLKPSKMLERDPLLLKIFMTSLVLSMITVTALMNAQIPQNIDAEQIPDRLATILYQPEKYAYDADKSKIVDVSDNTQNQTAKAQPIPQATMKIVPNAQNANKPVPKEMNVGSADQSHHAAKSSRASKANSHAQGEAKEGRGARAKGTEGRRGSTHASAHGRSQAKAMRPSPNGGAGNGGGASQVEDNGNVDILKGATSQIENILGDSAAALGKGGEKLKGFGGFNTVGDGGLALSGTGKGGGGNANTTLGGLANKGRGGGRVGTGLGAAGNGNGIVGGQSRVVIRTGGPEEAVVMGAIDADAVEAALLAHKDEFRLCYEREINAENPSLAGRVGTSFVIGSSGHVDQAGIESTTLHNANTERCILQVLKRIEFPIPRGAGTVQVTYPFKFTPVGT